jgi:tetratricopeptide (TPR) repeat protein
VIARVEADFVQAVALGLAYWARAAASWHDLSALHDPADWANVERVVAYGLQLECTYDPAADLCLRLFSHAEFNGRWTTWIPLLQMAVAHCPPEEAERAGSLRDRLGQLFRLAWRLDDAVREHRLAFELAQQRGDPVLEAHSLFNLSEDYRYLNQLDQAEYCGGEALAGFARLSEADPRRADVLNTLGLVAHGRGQTALAIERLEAAIAGLEAQGRYVETARGLVNLGWILGDHGEIEPALAAFQRADALLSPTAFEPDKVRLYLNWGTVLFQAERHVQAQRAFLAADSEYLRRSGDRFLQALTANNLGNVLFALGQPDTAAGNLERAIRLWRGLGDGLQLGNSLGTLGEVRAAVGQVEDAERHFLEALACLKAFPDHAWAQRLQAKYQMALERLRRTTPD